jgi:beta-barrel assembly-enhancing protease
MPSTWANSEAGGAPTAHFSDGRSAARHEVVLRLTPATLRIVATNGDPLAEWPLDTLRFVDKPRPGQPVRFASGPEDEARLTVTDAETVRRLGAAMPEGKTRPVAFARTIGWSAGAAVIAIALYLAFPLMIEHVAPLVPLEWEERLGEATVEQLVTQMLPDREDGRFCSAAAGTTALERLTDRLAANTETPYRFTVRVVDAEAVNAFATPGGHIVLMRGLLEAAGSPDEVAGVLAHEMGHVVERHATEAVLRHMGMRVVLETLFSDPSSLLPNLGEAATAFLDLSYSRAAETEADAVGLEMLDAAGIRADGLAAFFERLNRERGAVPKFAGFLSTHPATEARAQAARAAMGRGGDAMPPADWNALEAVCARKSG